MAELDKLFSDYKTLMSNISSGQQAIDAKMDESIKLEQSLAAARNNLSGLEGRLKKAISQEITAMGDALKNAQEALAHGKIEDAYLLLSAPRPAQNSESSRIVIPGPFAIQSLDDRYVISPVQYHGKLHQVSLSKNLLDGGKSHSQDKWCNILQNTEWQLPSGPQMIGLMTALYNEREGTQKTLISEIQKKLKKDFKECWMMTGTRIKYKSNGPDEVIHNYHSLEEYSVDAVIVGLDNWVTPASGFEESIEGLLGIRDLAQLEKVSEWVSSKKPYLWRVNSKPKVDDVRALALGVYGNYSFDADGSINYDRPARGVASQNFFKR